MNAPNFDWLSKDFCKKYEMEREISLNEVHYGWLSPGENTLELLSDVPKGSRVLDVGCGMGENMCAVHKLMLDPYGIDVSAHMLKKAGKNMKEEGVVAKKSQLKDRIKECNAEDISQAFRHNFQVALSVYSLEFFENIDQFRKAIAAIVKKLEPKGSLILCVSHPMSHPAYPNITNETSASASPLSLPTLIYSIRDVVHVLCESNLVVERIIEQTTLKPSRISYEESLQFPYRFKKGKNPFSPLFDDLNDHPHTIIYKSQKVATI